MRTCCHGGKRSQISQRSRAFHRRVDEPLNTIQTSKWSAAALSSSVSFYFHRSDWGFQMKYLVKLSYFFIKQAKTENSNADPCFYTWCVRMTSFLLLLSQLAVGTLHQTPHPQLSHESRAVRYPPYDLTPQNPGALKGKHGDRNDGWQPEVEKCETSSIMGEERSTVTVSPLVRARSGGTLRSTSCSQSSFTWERAGCQSNTRCEEEFITAAPLQVRETRKVRKLSSLKL